VPADSGLLSLELPARREAPSSARKALASLNGALHLVSDARLLDAQLMVTELVSNAVLHGGDDEHPLRVEVRADEESMIVTVIDLGGGFDPDRLTGPSPDRSGGWGIPLVDALAHRWGVESGALTSVWFEIQRPAREAPLPTDSPII
jgi:anti-sigma regulatory factor (Ser/Thr protein kinase)